MAFFSAAVKTAPVNLSSGLFHNHGSHLEVFKESRVSSLHLSQEHLCDLSHIRVCGRSGTEPKEVPPFPHIGRHDHLGLRAVGKNRPGLLWSTAEVQHIEIGFFCLGTSPKTSVGKLYRLYQGSKV